jgi:hypothetical protein
MADDRYRVSRYPHSRIYHWQWRCLHTRTVGVDPNPSQCPEGGLARSEGQAAERAGEHAATHNPDRADKRHANGKEH